MGCGPPRVDRVGLAAGHRVGRQLPASLTVPPIPITDLAAALELGDREVVSLVGGGGKTSSLFALGRQLSGSVVLTTTTKMGSDRTEEFAPLLSPSDADLGAALDRDRVVLAWRGIDDHRAEGFTPEVIDRWCSLADHVVVEADGSRRRPFKAPAAHEPVVPASTTTLVACVGAGAFGAPIAVSCHRPELVAAIAECAIDDLLDPARLARVLVHDEGSRKACPAGARFVVALHQVVAGDLGYVAELRERLGDEVEVIVVAPFG